MPPSSPPSRSRIARAAGFAAVVALVATAGLSATPWVAVVVTPSASFHAIVALLRVARSAYIALMIALPPTIGLLALARLIGRRPWTARALAVGLGLGLGMLLAEGVSSARLEAMRVPIPRLTTHFPDPPGDRVVDVVVLGASSARGVPYHDRLSFGEMIAGTLRETMPGREFPVTDLSEPALKLDQVHQRLGWLKRRPDLLIVYAGHNEFSMRYDWSHGAAHYRDESPPKRPTLIDRIGRLSRVCGVIDATVGLLLRATPPTRVVSRRLVDVPVYTGAEYAERLRDFRVRLESIASYGERVGATVVLVIPPGNDADFEPSRSFLPPETPRSERDRFAAAFEEARRREASDPSVAIAEYRALIAREPGFAESHYRLARLLEASGRRDEADAHYINARDRDGLPLRCPSDFQQVYREVAARHPGAILIDGPAVLRGLTPRGLAGDAVCADAMHPSLLGYAGLAEAILRALWVRRSFGWEGSEPRLTTAEVARRFGIGPGDWGSACHFSAKFYLQTAEVRYDPDSRRRQGLRFLEAAHRIESGIGTPSEP